jgi:hypothetical protein
MARNGPAHHHNMVMVQKTSGLIDGTGHRWRDIASDLKQDLLEDGCVQSRTCNTDFIQATRVVYAAFGQFDALSGG